MTYAPYPEDAFVPREVSITNELADYIVELIESAPGKITFRTGAGRVERDLLLHWPVLDNREIEAQILCKKIAEAVFPLLGSLYAQGVEVTAVISNEGIEPPKHVELMSTYVIFDPGLRIERTIFLSPKHDIPPSNILRTARGISVQSTPINYRYHTIKDDRERKHHIRIGMFELPQRLINEMYEEPPYIPKERAILDTIKTKIWELPKAVERYEENREANLRGTQPQQQYLPAQTAIASLPPPVRAVERQLMANVQDTTLSPEFRADLRRVAQGVRAVYPQASVEEAARLETVPPGMGPRAPLMRPEPGLQYSFYTPPAANLEGVVPAGMPPLGRGQGVSWRGFVEERPTAMPTAAPVYASAQYPTATLPTARYPEPPQLPTARYPGPVQYPSALAYAPATAGPAARAVGPIVVAPGGAPMGGEGFAAASGLGGEASVAAQSRSLAARLAAAPVMYTGGYPIAFEPAEGVGPPGLTPFPGAGGGGAAGPPYYMTARYMPPEYRPTVRYPGPVMLPTGEYLPTGQGPTAQYLPTGVGPTARYLPTGVGPTLQYASPLPMPSPEYIRTGVLPTAQYAVPAGIPTGRYEGPAVMPTAQYLPTGVAPTPVYAGPAAFPTPEYLRTGVLPTAQYPGLATVPPGGPIGPAELPTPTYIPPPQYAGPYAYARPSPLPVAQYPFAPSVYGEAPPPLPPYEGPPAPTGGGPPAFVPPTETPPPSTPQPTAGFEIDIGTSPLPATPTAGLEYLYKPFTVEGPQTFPTPMTEILSPAPEKAGDSLLPQRLMPEIPVEVDETIIHPEPIRPEFGPTIPPQVFAGQARKEQEAQEQPRPERPREEPREQPTERKEEPKPEERREPPREEPKEQPKQEQKPKEEPKQEELFAPRVLQQKPIGEQIENPALIPQPRHKPEQITRDTYLELKQTPSNFSKAVLVGEAGKLHNKSQAELVQRAPKPNTFDRTKKPRSWDFPTPGLEPFPRAQGGRKRR